MYIDEIQRQTIIGIDKFSLTKISEIQHYAQEEGDWTDPKIVEIANYLFRNRTNKIKVKLISPTPIEKDALVYIIVKSKHRNYIDLSIDSRVYNLNSDNMTWDGQQGILTLNKNDLHEGYIKYFPGDSYLIPDSSGTIRRHTADEYVITDASKMVMDLVKELKEMDSQVIKLIGRDAEGNVVETKKVIPISIVFIEDSICLNYIIHNGKYHIFMMFPKAAGDTIEYNAGGSKTADGFVEAKKNTSKLYTTDEYIFKDKSLIFLEDNKKTILYLDIINAFDSEIIMNYSDDKRRSTHVQDVIIRDNENYIIASSQDLLKNEPFMALLLSDMPDGEIITKPSDKDGAFKIKNAPAWMLTGPWKSQKLNMEFKWPYPLSIDSKVIYENTQYIVKNLYPTLEVDLFNPSMNKTIKVSIENIFPSNKKHPYKNGDYLIAVKSREDIKTNDIFIVIDEQPLSEDITVKKILSIGPVGKYQHVESEPQEIKLFNDFKKLHPFTYKKIIEELDKLQLYEKTLAGEDSMVPNTNIEKLQSFAIKKPEEDNIDWNLIEELTNDSIVKALKEAVKRESRTIIKDQNAEIDSFGFSEKLNKFIINYEIIVEREMTGIHREAVGGRIPAHIAINKNDNATFNYNAQTIIFEIADRNKPGFIGLSIEYHIPKIKKQTEEQASVVNNRADLLRVFSESRPAYVNILNKFILIKIYDIIEAEEDKQNYMIAMGITDSNNNSPVYKTLLNKFFMCKLPEDRPNQELKIEANDISSKIGEFNVLNGLLLLNKGGFDSFKYMKFYPKKPITQIGDIVEYENQRWTVVKFESPYYAIIKNQTEEIKVLAAAVPPVSVTHPYKVDNFLQSQKFFPEENINQFDIFLVKDVLPNEGDIILVKCIAFEKGKYRILSAAERNASRKSIYFSSFGPNAFKLVPPAYIMKIKESIEKNAQTFQLGDKIYRYCGIKYFGSTSYTILEDDKGKRHVIESSYLYDINQQNEILVKIAGKMKKEGMAVYYPIDDELEMKISKLSHAITGDGWFSYGQCQDVKTMCLKAGFYDVFNPIHVAGIESIIKQYLSSKSLQKAASS